MSRVILLLPRPDGLQLANCYKYVNRLQNPYRDIYTFSTVPGTCADADKILVVGHGGTGEIGNPGAPVDIGDLADVIAGSGLLIGDSSKQIKIALDCCYAGIGTDKLGSAVTQLSSYLTQKKPKARISVSGAMGATITIGHVGESGASKRLVVDDAHIDEASSKQDGWLSIYNVNLGLSVPWDENATSLTIKGWAKTEWSRLIKFADFLSLDLGMSGMILTQNRKISVPVQI